MWEQMITAYSESNKASLGTTKHKKNDWITTETWQSIENRRDLKKKILGAKSERLQERYKVQYRDPDRKVKKMVRADKRGYMEDLVKNRQKILPDEGNRELFAGLPMPSAESIVETSTCRSQTNRDDSSHPKWK